MGRRIWRRVVLAVLGLMLLPPAGFVGYRVWWVENFGVVVPGQVYRSGQMTGPTLGRAVRERGIKTVLNLRGPNPDEVWYRSERAESTGAGATQVDVAMSSCQWMSRAQLRTVVNALDTCERPILIHCQHGSERTGLVSAFSELLRPGSTLDDAWRQFSLQYLFVRMKDGRIMADHLDQYTRWLRAENVRHSPDQFRRWVNKGFAPGLPSREQWPYDPYPLIVVTRPERGDRTDPSPVAAAEPSTERR